METRSRASWQGSGDRLRCCSRCCTLCGMELSRKTINFDHADTSVVAPFLDEDSAEHAALERIVGERLASDSAELRALVLLGVGRVREALLEDAYNQAVDASDFEDRRGMLSPATMAAIDQALLERRNNRRLCTMSGAREVAPITDVWPVTPK